MTLQFRADTGALLRHDTADGGALMSECCCEDVPDCNDCDPALPATYNAQVTNFNGTNNITITQAKHGTWGWCYWVGTSAQTGQVELYYDAALEWVTTNGGETQHASPPNTDPCDPTPGNYTSAAPVSIVIS